MIQNNNSHNAYIAQASRLISEPVLSKILEDSSLTRQDRIIAYLYTYHFVTKEQCMKLCNAGKSQNNAFNNTLKKLCDRDIISLCESTDNEEMGKNTYRMRKKGIFLAEPLFRTTLKNMVNEGTETGNFFISLTESNKVTIDECIEYLSERCEEFAAGNFSNHTVGVNAFTLALLPDKAYHSPVLYTREREAFCNQNGTFVSIYEKTYRNLVIKSGVVRCDALLTFYYPSDKCRLELCVEQDTGSQHPSIIKDKIEKYCRNVFQARLETASPESLPLLVFSISGSKKITTEEKKRIASIGEFSPRDRYLARGVELAASIYRALEGENFCSLYELSAYLEDLHMPKKDSELFATFIDECIEKVGGRTEASTLHTALYERFKYNAHDKQSRYDTYIDEHFRSRRDMINHVINEIPGAIELMYQGASICTISTRHADMARSLVPSLCGIPEKIEYASGVKIASYAPLSSLECDGIKDPDGNSCKAAVRNVFTLSDGRRIAVENVGDDYGAYVRVKRFLEANSAPCDIICFFNRNLEKTMRKFLQKYKEHSVMKKFHIMTYNCVQAEEEESNRLYMYDVVETSSLISISTFLS